MIWRGIFAVAAAIICVTCALFLWFGVIHKDGAKPEQVENLSADVCYSEVKLTWDPAEKADGYYIYAGNGDDLVQVGEVTGGETCQYSVKDYTHDQDYSFQVAGYGYNSLTKNKNEGERSEMITAGYDSSQYAQKIPILTYHKVIPAGMTFESNLNITADVLEEQMKYLHDNGYKTLTLDEFREWHAGKLEVPVKSCMVTFDDGFYGVYYLAYPIIRKYDQAATVFCIGKNTEGEIDPYTPVEDGETNHYIRRDAIEKTREEYPRFEFESHTFDMHNRVDGKKPALSFSYEQIMEDCAKNETFGFSYMAYPWGAYSETMQKAVRDSGYKMAFTYDPFYYAKRSDDTYAINRIKIPGRTTMDQFIRIVSGESTENDAPEE